MDSGDVSLSWVAVQCYPDLSVMLSVDCQAISLCQQQDSFKQKTDFKQLYLSQEGNAVLKKKKKEREKTVK